jgi:hypothetical protein
MRRASVIWLGALVTAASLALVGSSPIAAGGSDCAIQVKGKARTYTTFGAALDAAAPGKTLLLRGTCRTDTSSIRKNLTIKGIGETNKLIPHGVERVLWIDDGATVTLSNLVIRGGDDNLHGGGLFITDGANVTLRDVTVTENRLSGPNAWGDGAGIYVGCPGPSIPTVLTMIRSTVSGNTIKTTTRSQRASGAGIHVGDCATATITNSTITGNRATATAAAAFGGGITVEGSATITHTTIVGNTATDGGSISTWANTSGGGLKLVFSGEVTLQATIIAGNRAETGKACDTSGDTLDSNGHNLIDIGGSCDGLSDLEGDLVGTTANPIDPLLGKLAVNGGLTRSMVPRAASPAVDAIPAFECSVTSDQRRLGRPRGAGCEIGSTER